MTDVLIRGVPDDVLAGIDQRARRLGLTRTEYLRRRIAQDAAVVSSSLTVGDLTDFSETVIDLGDDDVMDVAWR